MLQRLCIFCGSSPGNSPAFQQAAENLAETMAQSGIGLVYGGAQVGLMGSIADACLKRGVEVVGIIPGALFPREIPHQGLTQLHVVDSMHERKQKMYELSDAFVALPGGIGTLEELFEILTWGQLGLHAKPCGLLNVQGYYDKMLEFLDGAVGHGFLKAKHRALLLSDPEPARLLKKLQEYRPPAGTKWIEKGET
ncbi:MAG TPA: TIGR00730 family Rossman fold protein [bacterium]|nr:TIGR00730 family Rossman fold protein [bacterium]